MFCLLNDGHQNSFLLLTFSNIILNITFVEDLSLFLTAAASLAIKAFECARSISIRRKQNAK